MASTLGFIMTSVNSTAVQPDPSQDLPFHYIPTGWIGITFPALFGATTAVHLLQAFLLRSWFMIPTLVLCGTSEILGWAGRYWGHLSPTNNNAFLMQISTTIVAPSFMTAAMFFILPRIINELGPQYSRMSARLYSIIFLTADVTALIIQAVGGVMASIANNIDDANEGGNVMLGGIIIQLVAVTLFTLLALEFVIRYSLNRPARTIPGSDNEDSQKFTGWTTVSRNIILMLVGLGIAIVFIVIRSVYRTIELTDGWNGEIISVEKWFDWFDGMPIVVAMVTFNVFHPGYLLRGLGERSPRSSEDQVELRNV